MQNRRRRVVNVKKVRAKERREGQQSRYRHLYQVRRVNGDVIATVGNGTQATDNAVVKLKLKFPLFILYVV